MTLNERIAKGYYEWSVVFTNPRMGYRKHVTTEARTYADALKQARDLLTFQRYPVAELEPIEINRCRLVRPLSEAEAGEAA